MDECLYYPIDDSCYLKQTLYSTNEEFGFCAYILTNDKKCANDYPDHIQQKLRDTIKKHDGRPVILQTSLPGANFKTLAEDENLFFMTHTCYLELLKFFKQDWPRVYSKISTDLKELAIGTNLIPISSTLFFRGQGKIIMRHFLGSFGKDNLFLYITANSKTNHLELFFQLNNSVIFEQLPLDPAVFVVLARDYDNLENILTYKCRQASLTV